jgi:TatA/E family protein of Tat protein translocase
VEGLLAPWHILIVLVVALLVLGPSKLPEVGRQVGRGLSELRKFRESFDDDIRGFLGHDQDDSPEPPSPPSRGELPPADTGGRPPLPEGGD